MWILQDSTIILNHSRTTFWPLDQSGSEQYSMASRKNMMVYWKKNCISDNKSRNIWLRRCSNMMMKVSYLFRGYMSHDSRPYHVLASQTACVFQQRKRQPPFWGVSDEDLEEQLQKMIRPQDQTSGGPGPYLHCNMAHEKRWFEDNCFFYIVKNCILGRCFG